jgi:hypothetical protein
LEGFTHHSIPSFNELWMASWLIIPTLCYSRTKPKWWNQASACRSGDQVHGPGFPIQIHVYKPMCRGWSLEAGPHNN